MTPEQIENTFTYHKPFGNQPERYEVLRNQAKILAAFIAELGQVPVSGKKPKKGK